MKNMRLIFEVMRYMSFKLHFIYQTCILYARISYKYNCNKLSEYTNCGFLDSLEVVNFTRFCVNTPL